MLRLVKPRRLGLGLGARSAGFWLLISNTWDDNGAWIDADQWRD